jgi:hypothetical protein
MIKKAASACASGFPGYIEEVGYVIKFGMVIPPMLRKVNQKEQHIKRAASGRRRPGPTTRCDYHT